MPSDNRRLPGCKRAKHDHLLERWARLLRHDSSLSAGSHVSLQRDTCVYFVCVTDLVTRPISERYYTDDDTGDPFFRLLSKNRSLSFSLVFSSSLSPFSR